MFGLFRKKAQKNENENSEGIIAGERSLTYLRIVFVFILLILFFVGLIIKIYSITKERYVSATEGQSSRTITAAHSRGTIYDCNKIPMVNAESEYRISVAPEPEALAALSKNVDDAELKSITDKLQKGMPAVARADTIVQTATGLNFFKTPIRYYGDILAPHIVGYLDGDGLSGVSGAELIFDSILNKYEGKATVTYQVNGIGKAMAGKEAVVLDTLSMSKGGVALTIDSEIQLIAQKIAAKYITKGAVVIMDPYTGKIKASVSLPTFQPSDISKLLNDSDAPLINRAFSNYNLGSVFKVITAAAAIESGVPLDFKVDCTGSQTVGSVTFRCHRHAGHGVLDLKGALTYSCNPYFIKLAQKTGVDPLYRLSSTMSFDESIFLAEGWKTSRAILAPREELNSPAALGNMSFGQGKLMATPVHVAQMVSAVINGGAIIKPTLLEGVVDEFGDLSENLATPPKEVFSSNTAKILKEMMINVVDEGTGKTAKPDFGGAGGKTGTAQTGIKDSDGNDVTQGWFSGFFPAEDPKYVVVIVAEELEKTQAKPYLAFKEIANNINFYME